MNWFRVDRHQAGHGGWTVSSLHHWYDQKYQEKFNIKNFRVVTVCPNAFQRDARLEKTKEVKTNRVGEKNEAVGIKIFWFVSETDYNLKRPNEILGPIFKVARKDQESGHIIIE